MQSSMSIHPAEQWDSGLAWIGILRWLGKSGQGPWFWRTSGSHQHHIHWWHGNRCSHDTQYPCRRVAHWVHWVRGAHSSTHPLLSSQMFQQPTVEPTCKWALKGESHFCTEGDLLRAPWCCLTAVILLYTPLTQLWSYWLSILPPLCCYTWCFLGPRLFSSIYL